MTSSNLSIITNESIWPPILTESLKKRIKTAVIIGIPILFMVSYNDLSRIIFLGLLVALTAIEFLDLHYGTFTKRPLIYVLTLGLAGAVFAGTYLKLVPPELMFLAAVATCVLTIDLYQRFIVKDKKAAWFYTFMYATLPLVSLLTIYDQPYFGKLLIGCLLLVWVSDIAAYFVGKSIGKRKLMPSISPGKTREGFLGAGMITILSSYIMYNFLGYFSFQQWALIALLVWLLGSIGDLVESKLKRQLNIKDSGNILPGHGGFLDRFDGFIFCLPAVSIVAFYIFQ